MPQYLKNKDLLNEIMKSKDQDRLTLECERMFVLLVNRISRKFRYYNPMDREDCMQTALLDLFSNWRNFDINKSSNPFAYYSEVAKRGMARGLNIIYRKKGDPDGIYKHVSIDNSNDGEGLFSL